MPTAHQLVPDVGNTAVCKTVPTLSKLRLARETNLQYVTWISHLSSHTGLPVPWTYLPDCCLRAFALDFFLFLKNACPRWPENALLHCVQVSAQASTPQGSFLWPPYLLMASSTCTAPSLFSATLFCQICLHCPTLRTYVYLLRHCYCCCFILSLGSMSSSRVETVIAIFPAPELLAHSWIHIWIFTGWMVNI